MIVLNERDVECACQAWIYEEKWGNRIEEEDITVLSSVSLIIERLMTEYWLVKLAVLS